MCYGADVLHSVQVDFDIPITDDYDAELTVTAIQSIVRRALTDTAPEVFDLNDPEDMFAFRLPEPDADIVAWRPGIDDV